MSSSVQSQAGTHLVQMIALQLCSHLHSMVGHHGGSLVAAAAVMARSLPNVVACAAIGMRLAKEGGCIHGIGSWVRGGARLRPDAPDALRPREMP